MNPLINAETGMLYNTECKFITKIKYTPTSSGFTLIFASKPEYELPEEVFLMPGESPVDYTSFLCKLAGTYSEYYVPLTEKTWFLMETESFDLPEHQSEFRIHVSFPLYVTVGNSNVLITVKDISVGGLRFVSDTAFDTHKTFSFIFSKGHSPVFVIARIVRQRPVRNPDIYCYSCQFLNLDSKSESALRSYIFKESLIQERFHKSV